MYLCFHCISPERLKTKETFSVSASVMKITGPGDRGQVNLEVRGHSSAWSLKSDLFNNESQVLCGVRK